ncbi:wd repeat containing protein 48 [Moniliophthora roreri]|nr:wd repeat containing protein 48 [Moniliophthora roreri]
MMILAERRDTLDPFKLSCSAGPTVIKLVGLGVLTLGEGKSTQSSSSMSSSMVIPQGTPGL